MAAEYCKRRKKKVKRLPMCRSKVKEQLYRIRVRVTKGNVELKQKFLFRMEWEPIHLQEEVSKIVRSLIV